MKSVLLQYILTLADDSLIMAQRLSEWAYKAPFLEEDIALSNISLDLFGRANMFLDYAAEIKGNNTIADDLAFLLYGVLRFSGICIILQDYLILSYYIYR